MFRKKTEPADAIQQKIRKSSMWSHKVFLAYISLLFISLIPIFFTSDLRLLITKAIYLPIISIDAPIKEYAIGVFVIAVTILAYLKYCLMNVLRLIRSLPEDALPDDKTPFILWLNSISENPWQRRFTVLMLSFGLPGLMMFITIWSARLTLMSISYPLTVLIALAWVVVILFWFIPRKQRVYQPSSTPLDSIKLKRSVDASLRHIMKMETSVNMWKGVLMAITIVFIVWFHGSAFPDSKISFNFSNVNFVEQIENHPEFASRQLKGVRLAGANLESANFSGLDLSGSLMEAANIQYANLEGTDLGYAKLTQTNFSNAKLSGLKFSYPNDLKRTVFQGAEIDNVQFSGVVLRSVDFENATIYGADFENMEFYEVDFKDGKLDSTSFHNCLLFRVSFANAVIENVTFERIYTESVDFTGMRMRDSKLRGRFFEVDFTNAILENSDLSNMSLAGSNFKRTIFKNVDFSGTNFVADKIGEREIGPAFNLTPAQLYDVKTLYQAKLPPDIKAALLETHPHLFEPPEETQE